MAAAAQGQLFAMKEGVSGMFLKKRSSVCFLQKIQPFSKLGVRENGGLKG